MNRALARIGHAVMCLCALAAGYALMSLFGPYLIPGI